MRLLLILLTLILLAAGGPNLDDTAEALLKADRILSSMNLSHQPSLRPCEGIITSGFGWRIHPIFLVIMFHHGVDIANKYGTPIRASGCGVVKLADSGWGRGYGGYGQIIVIEHTASTDSLYAHLSRIMVTVGDVVHRGQVIGLMGSSGRSTGPHLHYELRINGVPVDPRRFWIE